MVIGLGSSTFVVSLIGLMGSRRESRCLLRTYALARLVLLFAIFGVAVYLLVDGTGALTVWLDAHWTAMSSRVCSSALSPSCSLSISGGVAHITDQSSAPLVITRAELEALAASHLLTITTITVLLFLVLLVDLLMACVLQCVLAQPRLQEDVREMVPLAGHDSDADDY